MKFQASAKIFGVALCLVVCMLGSAGATIIDNTGSWDGSEYIWPFGNSDTATYGEVITAPGGNLESFTFFMNQPAFTFAGYVYEWDGSKAVGTELYNSGPRQTAGSGGFEAITFNTGSVSLTAGSQYVLFASVSNYPGDDTGIWGYIAGGGNASSYFVFYNNGYDASLWTTSEWDSIAGWGQNDALAFNATFSAAPAPIPSTLLLTGSFLADLGLMEFRKKAYLAKYQQSIKQRLIP